MKMWEIILQVMKLHIAGKVVLFETLTRGDNCAADTESDDATVGGATKCQFRFRLFDPLGSIQFRFESQRFQFVQSTVKEAKRAVLILHV